jgi:hypothetical protein
MELQTVIDRLTETENLTDGLEDPEASWLLQWGYQQAKAMFAGPATEGEEAERLNALMATLQQLNRITADRQVLTAEDLAEQLDRLSQAASRAFGCAPAESAWETASLSRQLAEAPALEALRLLAGWVCPGST